MMNRVFTWMLLGVLISILVSGCSGEPKSKTVVIPDKEGSGEAANVNQNFEVNKIYKLLENEGNNGAILEWGDKEHVLAGLGETKIGYRIESVDYRDNSRQKLMDMSLGTTIYGVSPVGEYVTSYVIDQENGEWKLKLLNLNSHTETAMGVIDKSIPPTWSNNSQYVSFGKIEQQKSQTSIVVYDRNLKLTKQFGLSPTWIDQAILSSIQISNDGEGALIVKTINRQTYLAYGKLVGNEFTSQYEHPIRNGETFDFINDDQIVFVGQEGSLTLFDRRNMKAVILQGHISAFQLSKDRKYIAYSNEQGDIYAAQMQGNSVTNEKLIYKGLIAARMIWSPDNKKLLLHGRKLYERPAPVPAPASDIANVPFVIEFK